MADINFAHGIGVGDASTCASGFFYVPFDAADPVDNDGRIDTIKVDLKVNAGSLNLYLGVISGGSFVFDQYDPIATISTGAATGWQTFTAPGDFTAFNVSAGDSIAFYSLSTNSQPGVSSTGSYLTLGYNAADPPYSSSLALSSESFRIEFKGEGPPKWANIAKVGGVLEVSIAKICGVEKTNIAKINGVAV